ncbi:MAG: hypothetical protein JWO98_5313 [Frankiales bacterium]|nr:hypothetical protein [Frankiales bacterium]
MAHYKAKTSKSKYPMQLIVMITPAMHERITADAKAADVSVSEVTRDYLEAGIDAIDLGAPFLDDAPNV